MTVLQSKVTAKIVETKSIEANITIQKILDMICTQWTNCLDNYYIMDSEPELSTDDYSDSITVSLNCSDKVNIDNIIQDVAMLFEEELEKYIKNQEILDKAPCEEGENGVL